MRNVKNHEGVRGREERRREEPEKECLRKKERKREKTRVTGKDVYFESSLPERK